MNKKVRVIDPRNGQQKKSLGDKSYKGVEYQKDFFLECGLIVGSTNQFQKSASRHSIEKSQHGSDSPQSYDYLSKKRALKDEVDDVARLITWERNILMEFNPKYDADDDSSDEEAIKIRRLRLEKKAAD